MNNATAFFLIVVLASALGSMLGVLIVYTSFVYLSQRVRSATWRERLKPLAREQREAEVTQAVSANPKPTEPWMFDEEDDVPPWLADWLNRNED